MNKLLFKYFSKQIIVDMYPSHFVFSFPYKDLNFSISTFIYLVEEEGKWTPVAIGNEISSDNLDGQEIHRVDLFDLESTVSFKREDLIQLFLEYGIGKCFETFFFPQLRPVVFILGSSRFDNYLAHPRETFEQAAKRGGAGMVVLDKIELE